MAKTVVFVHSYCLLGSGAGGGFKLTAMASEAMKTGVEIMKKLGASDIIVSAAYDTWQDEFRLQKKYALEQDVEGEQIHVIAEAKNSYDEAKRAIAETITLEADKLVVVAEKWHVSRSLKIFETIRPEGLGVEVIPFKTPWFEIALEPSSIKSLRAGWKTTWVLWNKLFEFLTPLIMRVSK